MDVQNTGKNIIFDKALNRFRNELIRSIFKIEEKQIKVLKNASSRKYFFDYNGADGNGAEKMKEEIDENDTNSEPKKHVLLEQNNKNNDLTLAVKTMLNINGNDENRDQLSMEIDSTSNNRNSRSKKKQVQRANHLQKQLIHFDYYQQKKILKEKIRKKFQSSQITTERIG